MKDFIVAILLTVCVICALFVFERAVTREDEIGSALVCEQINGVTVCIEK